MKLNKTSSLIRNAIPKFNETIANGVSVEHFKELEPYIDSILKSASEYFPAGLEYKGYRRATPDEEVKFLLKKASSKGSRWTIELADSSIYLMFYKFEFEGELIEHGVFLPFLSKGGKMNIRGTSNTIIPVLTAPAFSVETKKQQIFLKLLMIKLSFQRHPHSVIVDGSERIFPYCHGKIHQINPKDQAHYDSRKDETVKMRHATVLYLLCEYGLSGMFKKYTGEDVFVLDAIEDRDTLSQIDTEKYSIITSTMKKPASVKMKEYCPHSMALIVPRHVMHDTTVGGLIGGFFYIADNYSQYMRFAKELDDKEFWCIILGKMCLQMNDQLSTLRNEAIRHMDNVRRMLDAQQRIDLNKTGVPVDTMIDLLAYIIGNFSKIIHSESSGDLYSKRLLVLRNVMENMIKGINMITFKGSNSSKQPNYKTIKRDIASNIIADKILSLQSESCTESIMSPSDNMMFSHTCKFLLQNNISKRNKKKGAIVLEDPDKYLHPSVLEIGSYQVIKKEGEVTGRLLLNPYQATTPSGITNPNPELDDKRDYLAHMISRD